MSPLPLTAPDPLSLIQRPPATSAKDPGLMLLAQNSAGASCTGVAKREPFQDP